LNPLEPADISNYLAKVSEPERELLRLFRTSEVLTAFDIGSCEGEDSVRYALRFPLGKVYAFEPLPANQELVRANFSRHAVSNAELVPLALSDRNGEAIFHVSSGRPKDEFAGKDWNYGNKSSSLLAPAQNDPMYGWVEFKDAITVHTETIDHFCSAHAIDRIDFIHMDVQGAEHLVLQGAHRMISNITAIWLEVSDQELYAGQKLRSDIEQFMRGHGFRLGFELRREIEGDQFYVNTHHRRVWPYLIRRSVQNGWWRLRSALGRRKRNLFS